MVWSLIVAGTVAPSTVTGWRSMLPRRVAMVLSSTRSIGPPEVLRIVAVESTHSRPDPQ